MDRHRHSITTSDNREASRSSGNGIIHRHANARMIEHVLLIWLDNHINEENDIECQSILVNLRSVVTTKTFIDGKTCVEFINNIKNDKVCMIISGSLGQNMVPYVHPISNVDSIYIFCRNKSLHEVWTKEWPKIKGIHINIKPICEALKPIVKQCEENSVSINFMSTNNNTSNNDSDEMNPSFLFMRTLKEIIMDTNFDENQFQQLVNYCRDILANNENDLKNVDLLEKNYNELTPIWWFTNEYFLYSMVNRGLRSVDMNIIIKMSVFIRDLHYQIERLHKEQFTESGISNNFTVYHGQGVPKLIFEQMAKTKSGFISFTSFLCASTDRRISFDFAHRAVTNSDLIGIFFVITIDPSKTRTSFAFINDISQFEGKDEVLFPMHTIFSIRGIQSMGENNRLFQVDLTLLDGNNEDLRVLNNRIREETFPDLKGWNRLGQLLIKMEQVDKARQMYDSLLKQTTDESVKKDIYHQLGKIKDHQMTFQEAIELHEKTIKTYEKTLPSNHPHLEKWRKNLEVIKKKLVIK